jgi:hypothetical protein
LRRRSRTTGHGTRRLKQDHLGPLWIPNRIPACRVRLRMRNDHDLIADSSTRRYCKIYLPTSIVICFRDTILPSIAGDDNTAVPATPSADTSACHVPAALRRQNDHWRGQGHFESRRHEVRRQTFVPGWRRSCGRGPDDPLLDSGRTVVSGTHSGKGDATMTKYSTPPTVALIAPIAFVTIAAIGRVH